MFGELVQGIKNEITGENDPNSPNANIPGVGLINTGLTMGLMGAAVDAVGDLAAGAQASIQSLLGGEGPVTSVFSAMPLLEDAAQSLGVSTMNIDQTFDGQTGQEFVAQAPVNEGPAPQAAVARAQPLAGFTPGQPGRN